MLTVAAGLATGCVAHRTVLDPVYPIGGAGVPYVFWPPPPSTTTWMTSAVGLNTFGDAAARVAATLHNGGYGANVRWYPVGAGYCHGFVVTTRLEAIYEDGRSKPESERWSSMYTEPSGLIWLAADRNPRLPSSGRFRTLLIAFTDLPVGPSHYALHDNECTVLEGPDVPAAHFPASRPVSPGYQLAVYAYEYQGASDDRDGRFIPSDVQLPLAITGELARK